MKAMWSGAISFGLVNIPVKAYSATQDHSLDLHYVHEADGGRVSMQWVCKDCNEVIKYDDLAKGHEHEGQMVVLTKDELAALTEKNKEINVVEFVNPADIDPMMLSSSYYLAPQLPRRTRSSKTRPSSTPRAYVLLRETLRRTNLVAIARVTLRSKESLAVLRVSEDTIIMQTLLWADQIREKEFDDLPDGRIPDAEVSDAELDKAAELVQSMTAKWDPESHTDAYSEGLKRLVASKVNPTEDAEEVKAMDSGAQVIDLLARLESSMTAVS